MTLLHKRIRGNDLSISQFPNLPGNKDALIIDQKTCSTRWTISSLNRATPFPGGPRQGSSDQCQDYQIPYEAVHFQDTSSYKHVG